LVDTLTNLYHVIKKCHADGRAVSRGDVSLRRHSLRCASGEGGFAAREENAMRLRHRSLRALKACILLAGMAMAAQTMSSARAEDSGKQAIKIGNLAASVSAKADWEPSR
jgi:hypothetical protein